MRPVLTKERKLKQEIDRNFSAQARETQVLKWSEDFQRSIQDDEGFKNLMLHVKALHKEHEDELNVLKAMPIAEIMKSNSALILSRMSALELSIKDLKSIIDIPETYLKEVKRIMDIGKTPKGKAGVPPVNKKA